MQVAEKDARGDRYCDAPRRLLPVRSMRRKKSGRREKAMDFYVGATSAVTVFGSLPVVGGFRGQMRRDCAGRLVYKYNVF